MAMPEKWWRDNTSCVDAAVSTRLDQVVNYSRTTTIYEGEAPFIKSLELRLERAFGLQRAYGGKWCANSRPGRGCTPPMWLACRHRVAGWLPRNAAWLAGISQSSLRTRQRCPTLTA
jgi:hypothetical protein